MKINIFNKTKEKFIIDLEEACILMDLKYPGLARNKEEKGIFTRTSSTPIIKFGEPYFCFLKNGEADKCIINDVAELEFINKIFDNNDCVLLDIERYSSIFSTVFYLEPNPATFWQPIIVEAIREELSRLVPLKTHFSRFDNALRTRLNIESEYFDQFNIDCIFETCYHLFDHINNFINNDIWNLYFIESKGFNLYIEKGEDFRIVDWMEKHYASINSEDKS